MNKSLRYLRHLAPVALALVLIGVLAPVSAANAATFTSMTVTPTNPTKSATSNWTIGMSSATAGTVKCLLVYVDTAAAFTSTSPKATFAAAPTAPASGTNFFSAGTWDSAGVPTINGSTSSYKWTSTGGMTAPGGTVGFGLALTNPAISTTYYVRVATFTDVACTAAVDSGSSAAAVTDNTVITVTVDPTFTFAVNGASPAATCNGLTQTAGITTDAVTIPFGHLTGGGASLQAIQSFLVTSNAGNGYTVYLHSNAATTGVMKGTGSRKITDIAANTTTPGTGEFFGYTTNANNGSPLLASNKLNPVPLNTGNDIVGYRSAPVSGYNSDCVGYAVDATATTAADYYTATMVYTAVPSF